MRLVAYVKGERMRGAVRQMGWKDEEKRKSANPRGLADFVFLGQLTCAGRRKTGVSTCWMLVAHRGFLRAG